MAILCSQCLIGNERKKKYICHHPEHHCGRRGRFGFIYSSAEPSSWENSVQVCRCLMRSEQGLFNTRKQPKQNE